MSKYNQLETSSFDAADSRLPVTANVSGDAHDLPAIGYSALMECSETSPVATLCSSAEAEGVSVITLLSLVLGGGASVNSSSSSTNALNQQSFPPDPTTPTAGVDFLGSSTDSFHSLFADFCVAGGASHLEQMCNTLCARLDEVMRWDSVAALRGRECTVKRPDNGALESDWQIVFGAQVEQDEDGDDVILCYQASSRTHGPCAVRSLKKYNAALFQEAKSSASAVDSAAPMPPLYRAELFYMLACQESDAERKGDADFREVCARTAHAELCGLRGDYHADTLACLATLAVLLDEQEKIVEARECFVKCCEGRAATLGRDHEDTLGIQKVFTNFVLKHDVFKMVCADLECQDPVSIDQFKLSFFFRMAIDFNISLAIAAFFSILSLSIASIMCTSSRLYFELGARRLRFRGMPAYATFAAILVLANGQVTYTP
jgi:hypothetical protein